MNDPKVAGIVISVIILGFAFACGLVIGALIF